MKRQESPDPPIKEAEPSLSCIPPQPLSQRHAEQSQ